MKNENTIKIRTYCYWLARYSHGDKVTMANVLLINIMKDENPLAWAVLEMILPGKAPFTYHDLQKAADKAIEIYGEEELRRKNAA